MCDLCHKQEAMYEAWFAVRCPLTGQKMVNQRHQVCSYCVKFSIAYEKYGEKAFEMAKEAEWSYQI